MCHKGIHDHSIKRIDTIHRKSTAHRKAATDDGGGSCSEAELKNVSADRTLLIKWLSGSTSRNTNTQAQSPECLTVALAIFQMSHGSQWYWSIVEIPGSSPIFHLNLTVSMHSQAPFLARLACCTAALSSTDPLDHHPRNNHPDP